ncbi:MAG TPA: apolipoprotein N-acyltransferase [Jatrophihabitans sp.]|nr:apolipoprotein N-acyltransferase [Jatrophihabitans sp.]
MSTEPAEPAGRTPPRRWRPGPAQSRRLLLAAVSGLAGTFAFPPFGIWPLAMVSIAGLCLVTRGQRCRNAAWLGLAYGAGLFGPMLHWTSTYVGALPWLILVFAETWYVAALAAVLPLVFRLQWWPVAVAALWTTEEAIRDRLPFGGFPWGRWAFSQAESPLKWFAAVGGAPLVTFAVALSGSMLAGLLLRPRPLERVAAGMAACLVVVLGSGLSVLSPDTSGDRTLTVAAIQGNVPDRGLDFDARRRQVLDNHVAQTLRLAAQVRAGTVPKPDLVLWPENASDIDPTDNPDAAAVIQQATDAVGAPILVGAILDGPGRAHVTNAGLVWQPSTAAHPGPGQRYVKRHPVPFGEYIPLRSLARKVSSKVDLVRYDMLAGHGNGLLTETPVPVGDVICFEVAYDNLVNSSVRAGAQLLVIQTNNATFGHSSETYQQLAMARLRAVEHARTVVQVATSGKSAIIDPSGRTLAESGRLFTADTLLARVPLDRRTTLATRTGAAAEWLLVALGGLAVLIGGLAGRVRRPGRRPAGDDQAGDGQAGDRPPAEQAIELSRAGE